MGAAFAALSSQAQTFQNLDFESATLSPTPLNEDGVYVPVGSALPGWAAYLGSVQQTQVLQNGYDSGTASIDIFGPNYYTAGAQRPGNQGTIDGNYTVFLQSGGNPVGNGLGPLISASIAQTGLVPLGDQSLEFEAWDWLPSTTTLGVLFNGNSLSPTVIGSGPNYTLYGVDVTPYEGQIGTLEFSALPTNPNGPSWIELDDISFSPTAITPEPSTVALTAIGGLLFGA